MKEIARKIQNATVKVSLATIVFLIVAFIPKVAYASGDLSPDAIYTKLVSMKAQYPEGMEWTNSNFYYWNGGIYSGGGGCAGFAFLMSDQVFGDLPARILEDKSYASIRPGDILRINNDSHSVIVLRKTDSFVEIAEGNYNRSIHWGRLLYKSNLESGTLTYIMTRYPEGWGEDVEPTESPAVTAQIEGKAVLLSWMCPEGAKKFRIYRKAEGGSWKVLGEDVLYTYLDNTGVGGKKYYYAVRCINEDGKVLTPLDNSKIAEFTFPVNAPESPKPTLAVSNGKIQISWTAVADSPMYRVFRKAEGGTWKKLADVSTNSYVDGNGVANTSYTYAIRCLDSDGTTLLSALDNNKLATIAYPSSELVSPTPTLSAGTGTITVSFSAVSGSPKYRIFRKVEGGSWKKLADVSTTSYTDTTGTAGKTYSYAVRCLDSDGTTLLSKFDATKAAQLVFPSKSPVSPKPTLSKVSTGIKVQWTAVTGAAKYRIFKKTGDGSWKKLTDTTSLSYTDTKCTAGTEYSYAVRCLDADGNLISKFDSNAISVITK